MIRGPTSKETDALEERLLDLDEKERENAGFFALYNKKDGLVRREYRNGRKPLRTRELIQRFVQIRNEDGEIIPLVPNRSQRIIEAQILRQEHANLPVRIIILKARKVGASTWVEARGFIRCPTESHAKVAVLAHTDDTATEILKMAHIMRDYMMKDNGTPWKFGLKHQATYHIAFKAPMYGELMIASAQHQGGAAPFRGFTPSFLHMSEAAFYPDARATAQSALNAVPKRPGTAVFMESTANGDSGEFRDRFWSAWDERDLPMSMKRQSWISIFIPWFWREECRWSETIGRGRKLPDDITIEIQNTLTDHERWLLTQKWFNRGRPGMEWEEVPASIADGPLEGIRESKTKWRLRDAGWRPVTYDQLAWRRYQLKDEFNADPLVPSTWTKFQEEFPSTPNEAFRATGSLVFDAAAIYKQLEETSLPKFKGELVDVSAPTAVKMAPHRISDEIRHDLGLARLTSG